MSKNEKIIISFDVHCLFLLSLFDQGFWPGSVEDGLLLRTVAEPRTEAWVIEVRVKAYIGHSAWQLLSTSMLDVTTKQEAPPSRDVDFFEVRANPICVVTEGHDAGDGHLV